MTKAVGLIAMITLLIFVFFVGVNYSDPIKIRVGWMFETNEQEADLPSNTASRESEVANEYRVENEAISDQYSEKINFGSKVIDLDVDQIIQQ